MQLKRLLPGVATLIVLACVPVLAPAQNLLINPDLGLPPAGDVAPLGWTLDESPSDTRDPATLIEFADHTTADPDDNRGIWFKPFEGNFPGFPDVLTVDADLYQTLPAIPGQLYQMSGWSRFEGGYPGGVDNLDPSAPDPRGGQPSLTDTEFALEFLDILSNVLPESVVIELKDVGQVNDNVWRKRTIIGEAPLNAAFVRVRASMIDGEFNADLAPGPGQSAFVDDFSLEAIPEPASGLLGLMGLVLIGAFRRTR
jgi:hypothetical protein